MKLLYSSWMILGIICFSHKSSALARILLEVLNKVMGHQFMITSSPPNLEINSIFPMLIPTLREWCCKASLYTQIVSRNKIPSSLVKTQKNPLSLGDLSSTISSRVMARLIKNRDNSKDDLLSSYIVHWKTHKHFKVASHSYGEKHWH